MALGLFRGSFDIDAVDAIIPSQALKESSESLATSTFLPNYAYAKGKRRFKDDDSISIKSIGSQLSNLDEFGYDNDGAMSNESYGLLDSESAEEIMARKVKGICILPLPRFSNTKMLILVMFAVPTAKSALRHLHQWSLVEFDASATKYRMHNLVQLFAENEANQMGEINSDELECSPSSLTTGTSSMAIPLGKALLVAWKRRFVRHCCVIVATASHAYRFEGALALFDKE